VAKAPPACQVLKKGAVPAKRRFIEVSRGTVQESPRKGPKRKGGKKRFGAREKNEAKGPYKENGNPPSKDQSLPKQKKVN